MESIKKFFFYLFNLYFTICPASVNYIRKRLFLALLGIYIEKFIAEDLRMSLKEQKIFVSLREKR